jgi:hypothetical protein
VPIGSRFYYDSQKAKKIGQQPAHNSGRVDEVVSAQAVAAQLITSLPASMPAMSIRAVLPAKKRRASNVRSAGSAPGDGDARVELLVQQIVDLAGRTSSMLNRAEELARRAEQMLGMSMEAAVSAETSTVRAEIAAAKIEQEVATILARSHRTEQEGSVDDGETVSDDDDPTRFSTDDDRLKLKSDRLDVEQTSTHASQASVPPSTVMPHAVTGDFGAEEAPRSTTTDQTPLVPSFNTSRYHPVDALAHSLITEHHSGIPRVSPFIIHGSGGSVEAPASVQSAEAA